MVVFAGQRHIIKLFSFMLNIIFHEYKDVDQTWMAGLSHVNHTANLLKSLLTKENWCYGQICIQSK